MSTGRGEPPDEQTPISPSPLRTCRRLAMAATVLGVLSTLVVGLLLGMMINWTGLILVYYEVGIQVLISVVGTLISVALLGYLFFRYWRSRLTPHLQKTLNTALDDVSRLKDPAFWEAELKPRVNDVIRLVGAYIGFAGSVGALIALITNLVLVATMGLTKVQVDRLSRQNSLLEDQNDQLQVDMEFEIIAGLNRSQIEAAGRQYDQIDRVLSDPDAPVSQIIFAIEQIPKTMTMAVIRVRTSPEGRIETTEDDRPVAVLENYYPNLSPLKQRLLSYAREDRMERALSRYFPDVDPTENEYKELIRQHIAPVSNAIIEAMWRLGPATADLYQKSWEEESTCVWTLADESDYAFRLGGSGGAATDHAMYLRSYVEPFNTDHFIDEPEMDTHAPDVVGLFFKRDLRHVGSDLKGCDLRGAHLREANLEGANLSYAKLQHADLVKAVLIRAELSSANLSDTIMKKADLTGAWLKYAVLHNTQLQQAILDVADLTRAELLRANLTGAHLKNANLSMTTMERAILKEARLQRADISSSISPGVNFRGAYLHGANLEWSVLSGADFTDAGLQGVDLSYTYLQSAQFVKANLQGANLSHSILYSANLSHADLGSGTMYVTEHFYDKTWRKNRWFELVDKMDTHTHHYDLPAALLIEARFGRSKVRVDLSAAPETVRAEIFKLLFAERGGLTEDFFQYHRFSSRDEPHWLLKQILDEIPDDLIVDVELDNAPPTTLTDAILTGVYIDKKTLDSLTDEDAIPTPYILFENAETRSEEIESRQDWEFPDSATPDGIEENAASGVRVAPEEPVADSERAGL